MDGLIATVLNYEYTHFQGRLCREEYNEEVRLSGGQLIPDETKKSPSLAAMDTEAHSRHSIYKPISRQAQLAVAAFFESPLLAIKAVKQVVHQHCIWPIKLQKAGHDLASVSVNRNETVEAGNLCTQIAVGDNEFAPWHERIGDRTKKLFNGIFAVEVGDGVSHAHDYLGCRWRYKLAQF